METMAKEHVYELCFQMISAAGTACSMYMEALNAAKTGDFEEAERLIGEGDQLQIQGHTLHAELISQEAGGTDVPMNLILVHSEDQMMKTEIIKVMAEEFIEMYRSKSC